jgi:ssDNA-binding Zn-finger/Zn-ribbon topoisomerase 1
MYNIEYAHLSTTPPFVKRSNQSESFLEDNKDAILHAYDKLQKSLYEESVLVAQEFNERKKAFEDKKCLVCGGKLRYIKSFQFWGCENYSDTEKHTTFQGEKPVYYNNHVRINVNWLTDIIRECGIEKYVITKDLYNWLIILNEREDLLLKYTGTPSTKRINGYVGTKIRSDKMELQALEYLKMMYPKVLYQQCITYKLKDKKEMFCIPDFIVSNSKAVLVVDAKLDYTNDKKMDLYVELVKRIMADKSDTRSINGCHVMYNVSLWDKERTNYGIIKIPS